MLSSLKKINCLLVILGLYLGAPIYVYANNSKDVFYQDRFLFCLNKDIDLLDVKKDTNILYTNDLLLNIFIQENNIVEIERWLPNATNDDYDGDVYLNRIYRAYIKEGNALLVENAINDIEKISTIHSAERENIHRIHTYIPNDPFINQQCSLDAVKAYDAWSLWDIVNGELPGSPDVLLASVDSGVQWDHPDLVDNIWQNLGEDADGDGRTIEFIDGQWVLDPGDLNGNDDDGNTYTDDLIGWDPSGVSGGDDNDPNTQNHSHGTHVAGTLAATTDNGIGVAAAAFNSRIMPVKCTRDNNNDETINDGYPGILYAAKAGYYAGTFTIVNCSWGGGGFSSYEQNVVNNAHNNYGAVIISSAGNENLDLDNSSAYPAEYSNVLNISAVGCSGSKASFSNYGTTVDLASPGVGVLSTIVNNGYEAYDGTSMASPNAASCIGLLKSFHPDMNNQQLIDRILDTADDFIYDGMNENYQDDFGNKELGVGMVDCFKAVGYDIVPNLSYSFQDLIPLNGDGDNLVNPGESASLGIYLYNEEGWTDAQNVIGVLSCDSPGIEITSNTYFYGDIVSGGFGEHSSNLFEFDISSDIQVGDVEFTLSISADGTDGYELNKDISFPVSISLNQENWPQSFNQVQSSPLILDVDSDGDEEIIFGDYNGYLHVMNASGQELSGFPFDTGDDIWGSIASADLNLDGENEIVVTSKSKHLFILDIYGNVLLDYDSGQFLMGTPSIGNLDSDDELEVAFGAYTNSGKIFAINFDGTDVDGFPFELSEKMLGIALADFDDNGIDEIVFSTESDNLIGYVSANNGQVQSEVLLEASSKFRSDPAILKIENEFYILSGNEDGKMYGIDLSGNVVFGFETNAPIQTSPGFAILDNGSVGIFFGSQDYYLYGIDRYGNSLSGWPIELGGKVNSSPVMADLDGDGDSEVVSATDTGQIFAFHLDGTMVQNFPISLGTAFIGSPIVKDVDMDGDLEIFIGSTANMTGLDFKLPGNVFNQWNMFHGNSRRSSLFSFDPNAGCDSPLLGDINCDGSIDIFDITILVEIVLGMSDSYEYQIWASDANADGNIDIFDIISIVSMILDS